MFRRKTEKAAKRTIWRMSLKHPQGVYLAIFGREACSSETVELREHCYRASSFDLSTGAQVVETTMDTLPIELIDAFAKVNSAALIKGAALVHPGSDRHSFNRRCATSRSRSFNPLLDRWQRGPISHEGSLHTCSTSRGCLRARRPPT